MDALISVVKGNLALAQISCSHAKEEDWKISLHLYNVYKALYDASSKPTILQLSGNERFKWGKLFFWACTKYEIVISDGGK